MSTIQKALNVVQKVLSTIRRTSVIVQENCRIGAQKTISFIRSVFIIIQKTLEAAQRIFKAGAQWILSIMRQTPSTIQKHLAITGKGFLNIIYSILRAAVALATVAVLIYITTTAIKRLFEDNYSSTNGLNALEVFVVCLIAKIVEYLDPIIVIPIVLSPFVFALLCAAKAHEKGRRWQVWFFIGLVPFLGYLIMCILATEIKANIRKTIISIRKTLSSIQRVLGFIVTATRKAFLVAAIISIAIAVIAKLIESLSTSKSLESPLILAIVMLALLSPVFAFLCASVARMKGRRWWAWLLIGLTFNFAGYLTISALRERRLGS